MVIMEDCPGQGQGEGRIKSSSTAVGGSLGDFSFMLPVDPFPTRFSWVPFY